MTPRWILHVDGDAFFVSCEVASRPWLKGKPVVTGEERGIATAVSYEAKSRGVKRGMRPFEIRRICPDIVVLPSDYATYRLYAERMYAIVRRYSAVVEEYSIDECFADMTDAVRGGSGDVCGGRFVGHPAKLGAAVKRDLERELGMTFSVGMSASKVAAKVASKWNKPSGLTVIPRERLPEYLSKLSVGKVWGIGPSTAAMLRSLGIATALDLTLRDRMWICGNMPKPVRETYEELRGISVHAVVPATEESRREYGSVSKTGTFTPPSTDHDVLRSELSRHAEDACGKLRRLGLRAGHASFFLKTQEFEYVRREIVFERPTDLPQEVLAAVDALFGKVFRAGIRYRATGVTLSGLIRTEALPGDLFSSTPERPLADVATTIDRLVRSYGSRAVFLASSLRAIEREDDASAGLLPPTDVHGRRFGLPFLGGVH